MTPDGRSRVRAISAILDTQLDLDLRRRIGQVADSQPAPVMGPPFDHVGPPGHIGPPDHGTPPLLGTALEPGELGPVRTLPAKDLSTLVRRVVSQDAERTVWNYRGNEALVRLDSQRLALADGLILVALTLETDQTGEQELTCVFAVGSRQQPAGLLAVAEERPRGHPDLAATFAEAVTATCWRGLLLVVTAVAASAGLDADNDPLVPVALTATPDALLVHTIADHRLGRR